MDLFSPLVLCYLQNNKFFSMQPLWIPCNYLQVSFGSLVGFLPYRNLAARWKFLAFESWLKQKGLDPSLYKKNLGIIGSYNVPEKNSSLDSSIVPNTDRKIELENKPDMKLEDLLMLYDQEKLKFLSSFVGQVWKY